MWGEGSTMARTLKSDKWLLGATLLLLGISLVMVYSASAVWSGVRFDSPYLFLNSDVGLAHGREVHGQPKKLADPRVELRGDLLVGTVTRNGIDFITGTMGYKQQQGTLDEFNAHLKTDPQFYYTNKFFEKRLE